MKPCKVTVNGNKYIVSKYGVVTKIMQEDDITGYNAIDICDSDETAMVIKEVKRIRHNRARQARHQAYLDCGMIRVKGALGGVYYE